MRSMTSIQYNQFALLLGAAITTTVFILFHDHGFDDPYITYRYAQNIADGTGFVYNAGDPILSTTTPLYALLLSTVAMIGLPVPLVSNAFGCVSLALGGIALWKLGRLWCANSIGVAGLLLYPTFPFFMPVLGAETTVYLALALLGVLAYARKRYVVTAVLLACATLARADAILVVGVLGLHYLLSRRGQKPPLRAIAVFLVVLGLWSGFAWWYFGSPFPVTLDVKQQQAKMAISQTFLEGFLPFVRGYWDNTLYRLHLALVGIGAISGLFVWRRWLLLPTWSLGYFAAYSVLGVSRYYWYYAPIVAGSVVLIGLGVAGISTGAKRIAGTQPARIVAALFILALLGIQVRSLWNLQGQNDPRLEVYREVGTWIDANTPQTASVGTLEVGIIGYYAERRIIGFAGLLQPATAQQMTHETTYGDTALWAIQEFQPEYLALQDGLFSQVEQSDLLRTSCDAIQRFEDEDYSFPIVIYECTWKR